MPPQVIERVGLGGRRHLSHDAIELEALVPRPANRRGIPRRGPSLRAIAELVAEIESRP
jgi:hypothetical protein